MPRERGNERACDKAIRNTLAYRSIFNYPLTYHQLYNTLLSKKVFPKVFFDRELNKLVKKGYIGYREGKYYHKGIKTVSWDLRYRNSKKLIAKAKNISTILGKIPWIKMICVTGSTAAFNADKDADIDIFIVVQTHRMWLTRGFVSVILKILNAYAQSGLGPGKFCTNLYIDEDFFTWPQDQRSVFTAHEILLMHPLVNKDHTYFKFLHANKWIKSYFAHFEVESEKKHSNKHRYVSRLVNVFEKLAKFTQLRYMQKKRTNETIGNHILHFKKNDNTQWILDKFNKLVV